MSQKRQIMEITLTDFKLNPTFQYRSIDENDYKILGELLYKADLGTVDDEGLPVENSIEEIKGTIQDKYGKFLKDCSFVATHKTEVIAATLLTYYDKQSLPLVAFTMTHPQFKNQGFCQQLLKLSLNHLYKEGFEKCFLAVNPENLPAIAAYKKVGFTPAQ